MEFPGKMFMKETAKMFNIIFWFKSCISIFPTNVRNNITANKTMQTINVNFATAQRAITPGQYIAIYSGPVVLGNGQIQASTADNNHWLQEYIHDQTLSHCQPLWS